MSARFFQSDVPQENQYIKCNDLTVRGSVIANESVSVAGGITTNAELGFEDGPVAYPLGPAMLNKTIVVCNKMGSTAALTTVIDFVSITAAGGMTLTRYNYGAVAATGLQRLAFKLIQTA